MEISHPLMARSNITSITPCSPWMVITLKLHSFHLIIYFEMLNHLPHLNFDFSTLYYYNYTLKNSQKLFWNKNEACPTTPSMESGHKSKLKIVLVQLSIFLTTTTEETWWNQSFLFIIRQPTKNDKCRYLFISYSDPTWALKTLQCMWRHASVKDLLLLAV